MPGHRINPFISSAPYVHHLEANLHIFNVVCSFQGVELSFHVCVHTAPTRMQNQITLFYIKQNLVACQHNTMYQI